MDDPTSQGDIKMNILHNFDHISMHKFPLAGLGIALLLIFISKRTRFSMISIPLIVFPFYTICTFHSFNQLVLNSVKPQYLLITLSGYVMGGIALLVGLLAHTILDEKIPRLKELSVLLCFLLFSLLGAFTASDMLSFYVFFEMTLIPLYFMLSYWGGEEGPRAAKRFFLYTFGGSLFMLVGIIGLYKVTGTWSFYGSTYVINWSQSSIGEVPLFGMVLLGLLIKAPMFPFHSWMPLTYAYSPAPMIIYSALVLKLGSYGLYRFIPYFPNALQVYQPILIPLAAIGVLYGAILASVQKDLRRVVAFSSLSHMSMLLVGIFSWNQFGLQGSYFQQISHTLVTALLVFLIECIYKRTKSYQLDHLGGLRQAMGFCAFLFFITTLANMGVPSTSGFIGEFLCLLGVSQSQYPIWTLVAASGMIFSAVYMLRIYQAIFYGPVPLKQYNFAKDLMVYERVVPLFFLLLILMIGIVPNYIYPTHMLFKETKKLNQFGYAKGVEK